MTAVTESSTGGARPSDRMRRLAWASLVANILIVVTGGLVRLTESGLGCPTWPRCTDDSFTSTPEYGLHGVIEFGNRLLTFVLLAIAVATLIAAWRQRPRRPDLRLLATLLFVGIPLQGVIGGITVLTGLNPWVVMLHFMLSTVLIALAMVLIRRTAVPGGRWVSVVPRPVRLLTVVMAGVTAAVVYAGVVTTGSGPHAGDPSSPRTGLDLELLAQLHAGLVILLVGLTAGLLVVLHPIDVPVRLRRAAWVLLAVELAQGLIGYVQYFTGLPEALVLAHMLGSALVVVAMTDVVVSTRAPLSTASAPEQPERPVTTRTA